MSHQDINKRSHEAIEGLEPKSLWESFYEISRIPRKSKNEKKASEWLIEKGKKLGLEVESDAHNNVVYRIPASKGFENVPGVILQGHTDMICVKRENKIFNFETDPIELINKDGWITSNDTTLGADNGIGVAIILSLCELRNTFTHGPFECVFTVDEETDMVGVHNFGMKLNGKYFFNLDYEDWGEICVGSAGGKTSIIGSRIDTEIQSYGKVYRLCCSGLLGGHSGIDIIKERCNVNKFLNKFILRLIKKEVNFHLVEYDVDNQGINNAIPNVGNLLLRFDEKELKTVNFEMKDLLEETIREYGSVEKNDKNEVMITFTIDEITATKKHETCWRKEFLERFNMLLLALPNGVIRMSHDIKGVVETSTNIGMIVAKEGFVEIGMLTRSFNKDALITVGDQIKGCASLAKFDCHLKEGGFPNWMPDMDSEILKKTILVFRELFNIDPEPLGCHAGLECGAFKNIFPKLECISIGPNIVGAHSADEKVEISTTNKLHDFMKKMMGRIAKDKK